MEACRRQQTVVLTLDQVVTLAAGLFEAPAIEDTYDTPGIANEAGLCEGSGGRRDTGAPSAQHIAQKFMR